MRSGRGSRSRRGLVVLLFVATTASTMAFVPAEAVRTLREKDLNLDIARRVEARLKAAGVRVYMTRTTDRTLSLASRVALANGKRVDAFLSLHNNGSSNHAAHGTEVYRQVGSSESAALGSALRKELARSPGMPTKLIARRGSHGDYYYVLRNADVPAVIVEGAYVSNPSDARRLATSSFRQALADSIARAILAYQRTLVANALPDQATPNRVVFRSLATPTNVSGFAVNARSVSLGWDPVPSPFGYNVYRDGALIGRIDNGSASKGRVSFADVWAAPGQTYTYEIANSTSSQGTSFESTPARVSVRTPTIVVALDPGHGGKDPGAMGGY